MTTSFRKRVVPFALFLLLFIGNSPTVPAQESPTQKSPAAATEVAENMASLVAPLVTESTFCIVHLDLKALDVDKLYSGVLADLNSSVAFLGFDESSVKRIAKETEKLIQKAKTRIKGHLANLKDKGGIDNVFLLVQFDSEEDDLLAGTVILAVPVAKRTDPQREFWRNLLSELLVGETEFVFFEHAGFDIALLKSFLDPDTDEIFELDEESGKEILLKRKPQAEQFLKEAWEVGGRQPMRMIFFYTPHLTQYLKLAIEKSSEENPEMTIPKSFLDTFGDLTNTFSRKTQWAVTVPDFDKMSFETVIKANDAKDAVELFLLTGKMYDSVGDFYKELMAQLPMMQKAAPLVGELVKGGYRTMMPTVENDRLVMRMESKHYGNFFLTFYTALLANLIPKPEEY